MFEDLEKIPFLSEPRGPAIKNEVVASSIQDFFEESQAEITAQYEMMRAVDFSWALARVGGIHCLAGQVLCCPSSSSNSHLWFYF